MLNLVQLGTVRFKQHFSSRKRATLTFLFETSKTRMEPAFARSVGDQSYFTRICTYLVKKMPEDASELALHHLRGSPPGSRTAAARPAANPTGKSREGVFPSVELSLSSLDAPRRSSANVVIDQSE